MPAHDRPRTPYNLPLVGLLALLLLGGLWYAGLFGGRSTASAAGTPATTSADPWPTAPATFTPVPAANTALVKPTPIPLPQWEEVSKLKVIELSLFSYQEVPVAKPLHLRLTGTTVPLKLKYQINLFVDMGQIKPADMQRSGNTIILRIPRPTLDGNPAFLYATPLRPGDEVQDYFDHGLPQDITGKGVADVVQQFEQNDGLRQLVDQAAINQVRRLLETLGFRQVKVEIAE